MGDSTKPDQTRPPEVNDRQSIAIDVLITGATHREAAEAAGVQRTTVTAWCNKNITFIAEWNRRRRQRLAAAGERLHEAIGARQSACWPPQGTGDPARRLMVAIAAQNGAKPSGLDTRTPEGKEEGGERHKKRKTHFRITEAKNQYFWLGLKQAKDLDVLSAFGNVT